LDFNRVAFFGDSWVYGAELDSKWSFPCLLGSNNYGVNGTSIPGLLRRFNEVRKDFSIAIFCLTDPSRQMFYKDYNNYKDHSQGTAQEISELRILQMTGNDYNDDIVASQTLYILYKWCQDLGIQCYFVNLFAGQLAESFLYDLIPDNAWLISKRSCLVKEVFDTQNYFVEYPHCGDFSCWLQDNNSDVQNFIRPCEYHPNRIGHRAIADFIINKFL